MALLKVEGILATTDHVTRAFDTWKQMKQRERKWIRLSASKLPTRPVIRNMLEALVKESK